MCFRAGLPENVDEGCGVGWLTECSKIESMVLCGELRQSLASRGCDPGGRVGLFRPLWELELHAALVRQNGGLVDLWAEQDLRRSGWPGLALCPPTPGP